MENRWVSTEDRLGGRFPARMDVVDLDVMTEPASWGAVQQLARDIESAHFAGLVLTEMRQPPWVSVVAAHQAAPTLQLSTGIVPEGGRSRRLA